MNFDEGLTRITKALANPLPGEMAQRMMAPVSRKTMEELLKTTAGYRHSSVMMLLYPDQQGKLHTLLIERPVSDSVHSGQIAFPGGKVEPEDESVAHTAKRETEEEVGVPASSIEVIGQLSRLIIPASNFIVHPHIGVITSTPKFIPSPLEVQSLLPISIEQLLSLERTDKVFTTSYGNLPAPCFNLDKHDLWGATAMMVSEFRVMMENAKFT